MAAGTAAPGKGHLLASVAQHPLLPTKASASCQPATASRQPAAGHWNHHAAGVRVEEGSPQFESALLKPDTVVLDVSLNAHLFENRCSSAPQRAWCMDDHESNVFHDCLVKAVCNGGSLGMDRIWTA
jgi:hypothetical protein